MGRGMPLPFGSRAPRHMAACVALFAALGARRAAATEFPGARLEVSRHPGAEACPDAEQLAAELSQRLGPRNSANSELLLLSVELDGSTEAYVAKVHVDGRKHGERTLRAAGPTCDSLRDALVVTLLVLLDEERSEALDAPTTAPSRTTAPSNPPESRLTTVPAVPSRESPATAPDERTIPGERHPSPATLWLAAGGGVTHGLPEGWSGALLFDLSVRFRAFEVSAGGVWAPAEHITSGAKGEEIKTTVRASGGRVRGCYAWHSATTSGPRVLGCATTLLAALTGSATGGGLVNTEDVLRPWWLAGASFETTLPVTKGIDAGISLTGLASLHKEVFTIAPLAAPYETDPVVLILALRLEARLF
jgi:hypothetical protein